ncbi:MAG: enoyl-CoA hydratase [Sulfurospirillum sp.]|nr:MAG: enoyl-CoA hydratase [Sulfurospirillum sp.]
MYREFRYLLRQRKEISVRYDVETASVWCYFNPSVRPCFSYEMLTEIHSLQMEIVAYFKKYDMKPKIPINFFVLASQTKGIFNYGGDLSLFEEMIKKQDRDTLLKYGRLATELVYWNSVGLEIPLMTLAVVEGTALGGGFEAALSSGVIIAEKNSKMGFPEIRFNLFPGMGAYSLLARSLGVRRAEELILSGKVYNAEELCDIGLLSLLAPEGKAREKAVQFMKKQNRLRNGYQAVAAARNRYQQLDREEFMQINEIWVDAALKLQEKDLKVMRKLIEAQNLKNGHILHKTRTMQDRRIVLPGEFSDQEYFARQDRRRVQERRILKAS